MSDRFAHRLKLDRIRDGERVELIADEAERKVIATRLGLDSIDRLQAHATLSRKGARVEADGRIVAALKQSCVVTGDPVPAHVDEPFSLLFVPEPETRRSEEEIELSTADCDVIFHDGSAIDLGAAIADTLALSLDPYPRSAAAEAALKEAGVLTEAEVSPFATLAKLKREGDT
ncbi:MAG TPA: DUF177 domain-containing protein [Sphingomicrobium sp.]|nr:DUF177 domain-containing protein [Sphingomicrobium sp.]